MKYTIKIITSFFLVAVFSSLISLKVNAAEVVNTISNTKLQATAEYLEGSQKKPAILILHGFLTTNKFHTVVSIAKGMHDEGFSVLTPSLSLGINKRKNSIKCNSIHTHTLKNDVDEVGAWIDWLENKGYKEVILVGHSAGSLTLLEQARISNDKRIKSLIFTSLFYLNGEELGTMPDEVALAEKRLQEDNKRPHRYNFLFCKNNYFATPQSFLSYLKHDRSYVLQSMRELTIPHFTIMGSADKRYKKVGENWLEEIEETGTKLIVVEGANHFFSSEHEFDLQDELIAILSKLTE